MFGKIVCNCNYWNECKRLKTLFIRQGVKNALAHHKVPSSSVVEHPTRSRRVVDSNPIWDSDFFRVYVSPRIYVILCCSILATLFAKKQLFKIFMATCFFNDIYILQTKSGFPTCHYTKLCRLFLFPGPESFVFFTS